MRLSRRDLLKGTAAAGTLAALGGGWRFAERSVFAQKATPPQKVEYFKGYCRMCMHDDCANITRVEDGIAVKVEGNPESPINKGTLCPRGNSAIISMYNPYRVKAPMKRTNPKKGLNEDPGWVEISWDEALDLVASKFRAIREKDPRRLMHLVGFGMMDYFTTFGAPHLPVFTASFGTPNHVTNNGALCAIHYATWVAQGAFPVPIVDYQRCNYHLAIGRTAGPNAGFANGPTRAVAKAMERGMRLVSVDPRCSVEGSKGEWVPIKPGQDLAFILALIHVILYEIKKVDVEFLTHRTNGPYLINAAGDYLRSSAGKPLMWDPAAGQAKEFDDPSLARPALEGEYQVNGTTAPTAFTLIKAAMRSYTPEWAEERSTVPAATIRRIANEFVEHAMIGATIEINGTTFPYRPVAVICARGSINHENGTTVDLASKILNELVGALDVPGGVLSTMRGPVLQPDADGTVMKQGEYAGVPFSYPPVHTDLAEFFPGRHALPHMAFRAILDPAKYGLDYPIEGLFVCGGNPVSSLADPELMAEAIAKVPFTASIAYHFDEVAQLSDVLLPEHAMLERLGTNTSDADFAGVFEDTIGISVTMVRKPVPPIYNTRHAHNISIDLLERIGALQEMNGFFNNAVVPMGELAAVPLAPQHKLQMDRKYTIEEIWDRALQSMHGDGKGLEYFFEQGMVVHRVPEEQCYNYFYFPGNKTRHPLFFWGVKEHGDILLANLAKHNLEVPGWSNADLKKRYEPIPSYYETNLMRAPTEYDLIAINWKTPASMFRMGGVDQLPWLHQVQEEYDPYFNVACLNAQTAQAKGLVDGDRVVIESLYGKIEAKIRTSQLFHPTTLGIAGATGRLVDSVGSKARSLIHFNSLISAKEGTFDPVMGAVDIGVAVKIRKV